MIQYRLQRRKNLPTTNSTRYRALRFDFLPAYSRSAADHFIGLGHAKSNTNLFASERRPHMLEPFRRRVSRVASHNFNNISIAKRCVKRYKLAIHFCALQVNPEVSMYGESKIYRRRG